MKPEDHILELVSDHLRIPINEMKGKTRQRAVVEAKQAFCYLCRNLLPLSLSQVGRVLNIDHATVLYSVNIIEDRISLYPREKEAIENLMTTARVMIKTLTPAPIVVDEEIYLDNDFYN